MSASSKVFSIPELLTIILEHGLAKDVLLQQRVNKTWQGVIQGSRSIRRKLHYDVDLIKGNVDESQDVEWWKLDNVRWNPLLTSFGIHHNELESCCQDIDLGLIKSFDFPTASWKAMYMTSPAVRKAVLLNEWFILGTMFSSSGITIGQLAEAQHEGSSVRIEETKTGHLSVCLKA